MTTDIKNRISKLCGGNPGVLAAACACFEQGGEAGLAKLEALAIRPTYIAIAVADICKHDVPTLLAKLEDVEAFKAEIFALPEVKWYESKK